jgi:sec-independent protein translocase protein TatB
VFNVTGSEVVILLLLALVVLGPEKLPDAIRRFGKVYGELRKMSQGFQTELRDALDEPMRELRSTADMARRAIEEPVEEISGSAKGIGQAATDAFAAATKFSAAPVQGGGAKKPSPPATADKDEPAGSEAAAAVVELAVEPIVGPIDEAVVPQVTDDQLSEVTVSDDWPDAAAAPMDDPGDDEPGDDEPPPEELDGGEERTSA